MPVQALILSHHAQRNWSRMNAMVTDCQLRQSGKLLHGVAKTPYMQDQQKSVMLLGTAKTLAVKVMTWPQRTQIPAVYTI